MGFQSYQWNITSYGEYLELGWIFEHELGLWTQAESANVKKWVSIPIGFMRISLEE